MSSEDNADWSHKNSPEKVPTGGRKQTHRNRNRQREVLLVPRTWGNRSEAAESHWRLVWCHRLLNRASGVTADEARVVPDRGHAASRGLELHRSNTTREDLLLPSALRNQLGVHCAMRQSLLRKLQDSSASISSARSVMQASLKKLSIMVASASTPPALSIPVA